MNTGLDNEVSFQIVGHTVEVTFKPLTSESIHSIKEQILEPDVFGAELRAIVGAVETLKVQDKLIIRKRTRTERRGSVALGDAEGIPDLYDEKADEDLWETLQKMIVARNPRLATREPFKAVFEQYADEDNEATKKDPTPLRVEAKTGT